MAGSYTSARKEVMAQVRSQAAMLVKLHAQTVLANSNKEVPQVGKSLGWATNALKTSGHIVRTDRMGEQISDDAYTLALSDAMFNRETNKGATKVPRLVHDLTGADFLPPYAIPRTTGAVTAAVYYPLQYAMALEMGFTMKGEMHPQAFFLMNAVNMQEEPFFEAVRQMLKGLENIHAKPILTSEQKRDRAERRYEAGMERAAMREAYGESGRDYQKYFPFTSFQHMLEVSGESQSYNKGRMKGLSFDETAETIRRSALEAWEAGMR